MKSLIEAGLEEDAVIEGRRDSSISEMVDEIERTIPKTEAEIEEVEVEQADRDVEAGIKRSGRFVEDKYFARQIERIKELKKGSYITVGKIKKETISWFKALRAQVPQFRGNQYGFLKRIPQPDSDVKRSSRSTGNAEVNRSLEKQNE